MDIWKRIRIILGAAAIAALLALLIIPSTRWRVCGQIAVSLGKHSSSLPKANWKRRLQQYPNDYQIQLAVACRDRKQQMPRLRSLAGRFPGYPSLYAHILGYAAWDEVHLQRPEIYLFGGYPIPSSYSYGDKHTAPPQLSAFDRVAAIGERLDPNNAYFPMMRAFGLFAAHRDTEALAALHRAAAKPRWTDYSEDGILGLWCLAGNTSSTSSAYLRMYQYNSQILPQYLTFGSTAKVAVYKAEQEELSGHSNGGIQIRQDLMRCGGLMRVQSTSLMGPYVAVATTDLALISPGGKRPPGKYPAVFGKDKYRKELDTYCAYLIQNGHGADIVPVRREFEAGKQAQVVIDQAVSRNLLISDYSSWMNWWTADLIAVANVIWLLFFGALAALLARTRQIRAGETMSVYMRWGILSGILLGAAGLAWLSKPLWVSKAKTLPGNVFDILFPDGNVAYTPPPIAAIALGLVFCAAITLAFLWFSARHERRHLAHGLGISLITAIVLVVIVCMANWGAWEIDSFVLIWRTDIMGKGGLSNGVAHLVSFCAVLSIPLITLFALAIYSLIRRVTLSVGLVRGFYRTALPLACLCMLAYGALIVGTVHMEQRINRNLDRMVRHEGRYYAELLGQPWPGPTNWNPVSKGQ